MTRDEYADKVAEVIHATYPEASVSVIETPPRAMQAFYEGRDESPTALRIDIAFASIQSITDELLADDEAARALAPRIGEQITHYLRTMLNEAATR